MPKQLITHSRITSAQACRKKHWWAYEQGVRKTHDATALRMGSNYHEMLDILKQGRTLEDALGWLGQEYGRPKPDEFDEYAWEIEETTLAVLVTCYQWRWQDSGVEVLATEESFRIPLRNPATGSPSTVFDHGGKVDGIVRLEDERTAVIEHKLLGVDHGPDSDLQNMLRMDAQVTLYLHAARTLGHEVDTIIYDVTRKPTIKPSAIPILDDDGLKVVIDADGNRVFLDDKTKKDGTVTLGKPRQAASKDKGWSLLARPMNTGEWSEKLRADIGERPDYYFSRTEIPRLDDEVTEGLQDLWDAQKTIREAQKTDRWFRTVNRGTCPFCSYFTLCCSKYDLESMGVPEGFTQSNDVHPEL